MTPSILLGLLSLPGVAFPPGALAPCTLSRVQCRCRDARDSTGKCCTSSRKADARLDMRVTLSFAIKVKNIHEYLVHDAMVRP